MKAKVLFFNSDYDAEIKTMKMKENKLIYKRGKYEYDIRGEGKTLLHEKTWFGLKQKAFRLFYVQGEDSRVATEINWEDSKFERVSPTNMADIARQALIQRLLVIKSEKLDMFMWIIIGGVIGFLLNYFLLGK